MTTVKAVAKTSFFHHRTQYQPGNPVEVSKGEAHDLEKDGLIEIGGEVEDTPLDTKMADAPENKMADAPSNKRSTKAEK